MPHYYKGLVIACVFAAQSGLLLAAHSEAAQSPQQRLVLLERINPAQRSDTQSIELARLYYRNRRSDEAYALAAKVLKNQPDTVDAWLVQYDVLREKEQWHAALNAANHAATLAPNRAEVQLRRGQALMALGKTTEADAAFARYRSLSGLSLVSPH